jgi:hypothetical protein
MKNPNPKKFGKDRSVDSSWEQIPMCYTGIKHPNNPNKELVIKEFFGDKLEIAWRNMKLCKMGIGKLVPRTKKGFLYKGKEFKFTRSGWVF